MKNLVKLISLFLLSLLVASPVDAAKRRRSTRVAAKNKSQKLTHEPVDQQDEEAEIVTPEIETKAENAHQSHGDEPGAFLDEFIVDTDIRASFKEVLRINPFINQMNHAKPEPLWWLALEYFERLEGNGMPLIRCLVEKGVKIDKHVLPHAEKNGELYAFLESCYEMTKAAAFQGDVIARIQELLDKGACINTRDKYGHTILHQIMMQWSDHNSFKPKRDYNVIEIIEFVLSVPGIDVNAQDDSLLTFLHVAVHAGLVDVVRLLLTRPELKVNAQNNMGKTALDYARTYKKPEMADLLCEHQDIDLNPRPNKNACVIC